MITEVELDVRHSAAAPLMVRDALIGIYLRELNKMLVRANEGGMSISLLTDEEILDTEASLLAARISCIEEAEKEASGKYIDMLRAKGLPVQLLPDPF